MKIETLAIHAGQHPDAATGAITPAINLSTTYERDADGSYGRGYEYVRAGNPNRDALETCLNALEGGVATVAFSSGMAAMAGILQTLNPGDHVVLPDDSYYGLRVLTKGVFARWGLSFSTVDMTDLACLEAVITDATRLVWVETPSNPLVKIVDIAAVAALAHASDALCSCDNTWATPVLQLPLSMGADMVMHSTTKYFGGHSDVMGGSVTFARDDDVTRLTREAQTEAGAVLSPFDSWLTLRGIQTLAYRVRAQSAHTQVIADFLHGHPSVARVHYPGLPSDPYYELAKRQMSQPGGMLSFLVNGDKARAMAVAARLKLIKRATSLGGTHTLVEHRASVEGPETMAPESLLRLAVGLEHPDDLLADLDEALS